MGARALAVPARIEGRWTQLVIGRCAAGLAQ